MSFGRQLGDLARGGVRFVNVVSDLRNVPPTQYGTLPIQPIQTLGGTSIGDGGAALWYWDDTSVAADDGEDVILPAGHVGDGRYRRITSSLEDVYRVGAIYFCAATDDPNTFLRGTWTKIAQGTFLVSAGGTGDYALGNTGGEASHVLTIDELATHSHSIKVRGDAGVGTQARLVPWGDPDYAGIWDAYSAQNPMQPIGTNQAHENRPPFLAVNMWQRTA